MGDYIYQRYSGVGCQLSATEFDSDVGVAYEMAFLSPVSDFSRNQIRVLVVPSRSTYFLDHKGQPRGLDYELLKGWEKILNKGRKKGTPPI